MTKYAYDAAAIALIKRQIEAQVEDLEREARELAEIERAMRAKYGTSDNTIKAGMA